VNAAAAVVTFKLYQDLETDIGILDNNLKETKKLLKRLKDCIAAIEENLA